MRIRELDLEGVLLVEPDVYRDDRGYFLEQYHARRYAEAGLDAAFVQDNLSYSTRGVLRGLHFQNPHPQGKLVTALRGEIFDVAVDIRVGSPTYGQWTAAVLSDQNHHQLYVPVGFAHGFAVLSDEAWVQYKCTDVYTPRADGGIRWDDPDLAIDWPIEAPLLSPKDAAAPWLRDLGEPQLFPWLNE